MRTDAALLLCCLFAGPAMAQATREGAHAPPGRMLVDFAAFYSKEAAR